jgi:hypothetical protein
MQGSQKGANSVQTMRRQTVGDFLGWFAYLSALGGGLPAWELLVAPYRTIDEESEPLEDLRDEQPHNPNLYSTASGAARSPSEPSARLYTAGDPPQIPVAGGVPATIFISKCVAGPRKDETAIGSDPQREALPVDDEPGLPAISRRRLTAAVEAAREEIVRLRGLREHLGRCTTDYHAADPCWRLVNRIEWTLRLTEANLERDTALLFN